MFLCDLNQFNSKKHMISRMKYLENMDSIDDKFKSSFIRGKRFMYEKIFHFLEERVNHFHQKLLDPLIIGSSPKTLK